MPGIILTVAGWFGISAFRLIAYAAIVATVTGGAIVARQHYINIGWYKHKTQVEKQDGNAVAASKIVEEKATACSEKTGYWDVISQGCKLDDAP